MQGRPKRRDESDNPRLRMTLDFDAKAGRAVGNSGRSLGHCHDFDGVHRFGLHPMDAPLSWMNRRFSSGLVHDAAVAVAAVITNVRCAAAGVPIEEKARPAVVMHRGGRAGRRHGDFQYAHQSVFENNPMTVGRGLHGVVAVGKAGLILPVQIEVMSEQQHGTHEYR